jgi:hypothetical protein
MRFSLAPREERFFTMFEQSVDVVVEGVKALKDLLDDYTNIEQKARHLKAIERRGDENTHRMFEALNRSFVTPIDREDILRLNETLDDILDYVEALAVRCELFKIKETTEEMRQFSDLLYQAVLQIQQAIHELTHLGKLMPFCHEIKRLENMADDLSHKAIADLFEKEKDPINLIKLKEIYARMESCMDKCEDVANIIETIVVKNG